MSDARYCLRKVIFDMRLGKTTDHQSALRATIGLVTICLLGGCDQDAQEHVSSFAQVHLIQQSDPIHTVIKRQNAQVLPISGYVDRVVRDENGGALALVSDEDERVIRLTPSGELDTNYSGSTSDLFDRRREIAEDSRARQETEKYRTVASVVLLPNGESLVFGVDGLRQPITMEADRFWVRKYDAEGLKVRDNFFDFGFGEQLMHASLIPGSDQTMAVGATGIRTRPHDGRLLWVGIFDANGKMSAHRLYDGDISEISAVIKPDKVFPNDDGSATIASVRPGGGAWFIDVDTHGTPIRTAAYYQHIRYANNQEFPLSVGNDDSEGQVARLSRDLFVLAGRVSASDPKSGAVIVLNTTP